MSRKFSLAFIGGGMNSAVGTTHKIASQMDGRFRLAAGCFSRDRKMNASTAEAWGVAADRTYGDWKDMLSREKGAVDAVAVLTPTSDHDGYVVGALSEGYPVICDKSLTTSSKRAFKIKEAVESQSGFLVITYNYTGYPMLRELRSMVRQGRLGRLRQVLVEMPQEGYARLDKDGNPQPPQKWRLEDRDIPMVSLDLGSHLHHIVDFLTGERPVALTAVQDSFGAFRQVVDTVMCVAEYTNGLLCNIWYTKAALGHKNGLRVRAYGDGGSAEWFQMEPEVLHFADDRGRVTRLDRAGVGVEVASQPRYTRFKAGHPAGFIEAFANYYCDIADALQGYRESGKAEFSEYLVGIDKELEGLMMFEAVAESATDRAWKELKW